MNRLNRNKRLIRKPTVKQKNPKTLKKLAIAFAIVLVAACLYIRFLQPYTFEAKQRVQLESTVQQLNKTKVQLENQKSQSEKDDEAKLKQIEKLNKELKEKDKQLQAKAATKRVYAAEEPRKAVVYPVSENAAKAFIYSHESGNNPGAINSSSGACGLGQALPCSKMPCSLSDYACQDAFFTQYIKSRYGTWANARAFWIANQWW